MTIYIVAKDGSGQFTTIQAAANVAQAGDTVQVKAGTYNEWVEIKSNGVTLKAIGDVTVTSDTDANHGVITATNKTNVIIDGIKTIGGYWGILVSGGSYNTVRNCTVKDPINGGLVIGYNAGHHALVENNIVDRTSSQYNEALTIVDAHDCIIRNNHVIRNTLGEAILLKGAGYTKGLNYNNKVYNNTCENAVCGVYIGTDGLHDCEIYNNVALNTRNGGGITTMLEEGGTMYNVYVHDNFAGNGQSGFAMSTYAIPGNPPAQYSNINFSNNITYNNSWVNFLNLESATVNSNNIVSPNYPAEWGYHAGTQPPPTCPQATLNMVI